MPQQAKAIQQTHLPLPHERLDAFAIAIRLVESVAALSLPRGTADMRDQIRRAACSVALNIGEGASATGADQKRYFRIARSSASEVAAALRVLLALKAVSPGELDEGRVLCARLYAMLTRLAGLGSGG